MIYLVFRDYEYNAFAPVETTLFASFSTQEQATVCADYMNGYDQDPFASYRYEIAGLDVWELPSEERASV